MIDFNYHTHTCFCDGKNTPMEMAQSAYEKGMKYLGFSGHGHMEPDDGWCMAAGASDYRRAVQETKEAFAGRMEIFCGVEQDLYSEGDGSDFDYAIGSVHMLCRKGVWLAVDGGPEHLRQGVEAAFDGDAYAMTEAYYEALCQIPERTAAKIVGHLDLPTKLIEKAPLFDPMHPRYLEAAYGAIDRLVKKDMIFEINTGAISRGWRTSPYPMCNLLEYIRRQGGKVMVSSDSHEVSTVDFALDEAARLARDCGFAEIWYFDGKNYLPRNIE